MHNIYMNRRQLFKNIYNSRQGPCGWQKNVKFLHKAQNQFLGKISKREYFYIIVGYRHDPALHNPDPGYPTLQNLSLHNSAYKQ
jgi:hypothetical protein